MKVILKADVEGIGKIRDIVNVKTGYANNYLIKNKLAVTATDENMAALNAELEKIAETEAEIRAQAEIIRDKLKGTSVLVKAKSGPEGRLYGAVTASDVAEAIKAETGFDIDKRKIVCPSIKDSGTYDAKLKLHAKVECDIKVNVEKSIG